MLGWLNSFATFAVMASFGVACASCVIERVGLSAYPDASRPLALVMKDLLDGQGKDPPNVRWKFRCRPLFEIRPFFDGSTFSEDGDDLTREALEELIRREEAGKLPLEYQRQIEQFAVDDLGNFIHTPGQYHLRKYLGRKWAADSLSDAELSQMFHKAALIELIIIPTVSQVGNITFCLSCNCNLPRGVPPGWNVQANYTSISLDGKPALRSGDTCWPSPAFVCHSETQYPHGSWDLLSAVKFGRHRLEITLQITIRKGDSNEFGNPVYSESKSLTTEFVGPITLPFVMAICRFVQKPSWERLDEYYWGDALRIFCPKLILYELGGESDR